MPNIQMNEFKINGPTYPVLSWGLTNLQRLNAVEWLKSIAIVTTGAVTPEQKRRVSNCVIDLFILGKFALILAAWYFNWTSPIIVAVVAYLLAYNLYTYFWYHLWLPVVPAYATDNPYRERRRFFSLLSAMGFSMIAYAYLYHRVLASHFDWPINIRAPIAALTFSIGNALTGATGELRAKTSTAYILMTSQLVMTFVFVAMLLGNSLPGQNRKREDQNG